MIIDSKQSREKLYELLGDLPKRHRPISTHLVSTEERTHYILEKLAIDMNGLETVPAYLTRPKSATGPIPFILYNHAHGGNYDLGKTSLLEGQHNLLKPPYAEVFSLLGFGSICIDTWAFGERKGRTEEAIFKDMLWNGKVMWGMMVYDSIRTLDYLESRNDVDINRIATLGISMGSNMAWWVAALDTRIKVCIDMCCLTEFNIFSQKGLLNHGLYYFVPSLLKHFTTSLINSLIAPRPHLGLAGNYDELTPPEGLDIIDTELKKTYTAMDATDAWKLLRYDVGHYETAAMRREIISFLKKWL